MTDLIANQQVLVRAVKFDGRDVREVWMPATFLFYDGGHPAVKYADGHCQVFYSCRDVMPVGRSERRSLHPRLVA